MKKFAIGSIAMLATALVATAGQAAAVRASNTSFSALRTLPTGTRVTKGKGHHVSDVAPSVIAIAVLAGAAVAGGAYAATNGNGSHHNAASPGGN